MMERKIKAVSLISGGLDSLLATRLILDQGIHVEGINFFTGFCVEGHTHAIRNKDKNKPKRNNALWVAETLGVKLHIIDIIEEYKQIVTNPKHGYGANLNPCLDCKIFMVKKAHQWIRENNFDFIITGEVVGQRPKSQRSETMPVISEESGANDLLVRPLCAKLLPVTYPEEQGWIDREKLLDLSGRNRKPQMRLAQDFGFSDYAQPAGGCCFLTDHNYSEKLADLWKARKEQRYDLDDIMLLKVGRHIRPRPHFKLIIARDDGENNFLRGYTKRYTHMHATSHKGPLVLVDGELKANDTELAAGITARFGQGRDAGTVTVSIHDRQGNEKIVDIPPLGARDVAKNWYV